MSVKAQHAATPTPTSPTCLLPMLPMLPMLLCPALPSQLDTEELARLRDSLRNAAATAAAHTKEAKLNESRAVQLAHEVDRLKEMLQVGGARHTCTLQRRTCTESRAPTPLPESPRLSHPAHTHYLPWGSCRKHGAPWRTCGGPRTSWRPVARRRAPQRGARCPLQPCWRPQPPAPRTSPGSASASHPLVLHPVYHPRHRYVGLVVSGRGRGASPELCSAVLRTMLPELGSSQFRVHFFHVHTRTHASPPSRPVPGPQASAVPAACPGTRSRAGPAASPGHLNHRGAPHHVRHQ